MRSNCIRWLFALFALLSLPTTAAAQPDDTVNIEPLIQQIFPKATVIAAKETQQAVPVWTVYQLNELIGYAFESNDLVDLPGFSGERINLLIGIDTAGKFAGIEMIHHHEPIFLHGLGEKPLLDFIHQYVEHSVIDRFIIDNTGDSTANNTVHFDGITKATVSVIIANDTIVNAALKVARAKLAEFAQSPPALMKSDYFEAMSWPELLDKQLVKRWTISRSELEQGLGNSLQDYPAAQLQFDNDEDSSNDTITLYYAYLNLPSIGINLLGEQQYQQLLTRLNPGEHAFAIMSEGFYSYLETDFRPGTVPNQVSLIQNGFPISIRDANFYEPGEIQLKAPAPTLDNLHLFRIRPQAGFDPSSPMQLQFIVDLKKNHLVADSLALTDEYQLAERFFEPVAIDHSAKPVALWVTIWQSRSGQIMVLLAALTLITLAFVQQHRLTRHPRLFHSFRWLALAFTLFFIGFYAQGQLSVVNIFAVLIELFDGFDIGVFLLDPIIFILWIYTFISLFLVGRGLFCGWLCPFGALQEMVGWLGKKLAIKPLKVPNRLHRRLLKIKYIVLLVLLGLTFYSLNMAEKAAEIEPFKTAITLGFVRYWPFVLYAVLLLAAGLYIHKFYCRYVCPLGAGLAILGHFKLFEWLTRRKECGSPCQLCHHRCEIDAIKKDGAIDYDECIQCLECIVIIHDPHQCAPAKLARKKSASQLIDSSAA